MSLSLDNFDIGQLLGRGGFATVYRARERSTGKDVAIKVISKDFSDSKNHTQQHERIINEIKLHTRLSHPNIVKNLGSFEDENYYYIVLELCRFGTLYHYLKRNGPMDEKTAANVLRQLLLAIEHIHSADIVHRDLKLSNILLYSPPPPSISPCYNRSHLNCSTSSANEATSAYSSANTTREESDTDDICDTLHAQDFIIKLCDFGLAVQLFHPDEEHFTLCGTPNYIAPEVASQRAHGLPADLWSCGCLFHSMLTGSPPFETPGAAGGKFADTLLKIMTGDFKMPSTVSAGAQHIMTTLLQLDPSTRPDVVQMLKHPFLLCNQHLNTITSKTETKSTRIMKDDAGEISSRSPNPRPLLPTLAPTLDSSSNENEIFSAIEKKKRTKSKNSSNSSRTTFQVDTHNNIDKQTGEKNSSENRASLSRASDYSISSSFSSLSWLDSVRVVRRSMSMNNGTPSSHEEATSVFSLTQNVYVSSESSNSSNSSNLIHHGHSSKLRTQKPENGSVTPLLLLDVTSNLSPKPLTYISSRGDVMMISLEGDFLLCTTVKSQNRRRNENQPLDSSPAKERFCRFIIRASSPTNILIGSLDEDMASELRVLRQLAMNESNGGEAVSTQSSTSLRLLGDSLIKRWFTISSALPRPVHRIYCRALAMLDAAKSKVPQLVLYLHPRRGPETYSNTDSSCRSKCKDKNKNRHSSNSTLSTITKPASSSSSSSSSSSASSSASLSASLDGGKGWGLELACKCMLMSNQPLPDFRVAWQDGTTLNYVLNTGKIIIRVPKSSSSNINISDLNKTFIWEATLGSPEGLSIGEERNVAVPKPVAQHLRVAQDALSRCLRLQTQSNHFRTRSQSDVGVQSSTSDTSILNRSNPKIFVDYL